MVQTRASLLTSALLVRCDLLLVTEVMKLRRASLASEFEVKTAVVDFSHARKTCLDLVNTATASRNVLQVAEGHLFFVQYAALERQISSSEESAILLQLGQESLEAAKQLVAEKPRQTRLITMELEAVERMLNRGDFYEPVSNEEMMDTVKAMATEFSGTGH
jgi:hypothetical protein